MIDPNEADGLRPSISTQEELNEFELLNIVEAVEWAEKNRKVRSSLLSPETLKLLHKRMFDKTWRWAGCYRTTQKSIGVEAYRIATELHNLCEDAKVWVQFGSYPPNEIAARFHHRLVCVHPFPNGNGRHARLATDLLGEIQGWPPFTWGLGLSCPGEARVRYLEALREADSGRIESLVAFLYL